MQAKMNERVLRPKEAAKFLGVSVSTFYELAKDEDFPQKVSIGKRAVGWWMSELKEWINKKSGR